MTGEVKLSGALFQYHMDNICEEMTVVTDSLNLLCESAADLCGGWTGTARDTWISTMNELVDGINETVYATRKIAMTVNALGESLVDAKQKVEGIVNAAGALVV